MNITLTDVSFKNMPQFTREGSYEVNIPLNNLQHTIDRFKEEYNLILNPDFQRGHVWNEQQQINWMEYFLMGGASGRIIYFNAPWWGDFAIEKYDYKDFVLVDGLQRITAFLKFLNNELAIFNGNKISDFKDNIKLARANFNLKFNVNNLPTKKDVLQWYVQMNSGGTPHTPEEIAKVEALIKSA